MFGIQEPGLLSKTGQVWVSALQTQLQTQLNTGATCQHRTWAKVLKEQCGKQRTLQITMQQREKVNLLPLLQIDLIFCASTSLLVYITRAGLNLLYVYMHVSAGGQLCALVQQRVSHGYQPTC